MDRVRCQGHETTLTDCLFSGWGMTDCSHSKDVSVHCADGMYFLLLKDADKKHWYYVGL